MSIVFRNELSFSAFGKDYGKVRSFLIKLDNPSFSFGRWDWMMTHAQLEHNALPKVGVWEESGKIVALASFDTTPGTGYFCVEKGHKHLFREMLLYSEKAFSLEGKFAAVIHDGDRDFQEFAAELGYLPTNEKEHDEVMRIVPEKLSYSLPDGFRIVSLKDSYDLRKYRLVMHKGFNHPVDEFVFSDESEEYFDKMMQCPNVNLDLKIAVVAPDGEFASYCGLWYDKDGGHALVEPLATAPEYRKMGLARAAVYEGIKRCAELGAKTAFVGSSQQFYYDIGFRPCGVSTLWRKKHL